LRLPESRKKKRVTFKIKRFSLLLILSLFFLPWSAILYAQQEVMVTIEDGYGTPGTSGNTVTVSADNQIQNTTPIASGEFWITYDSSIGINIPDTGGVETTERSQNHQVAYSVDRSSSTHVVHILLFSMSGDIITPGTGPILNLLFDVASDATPGSQSELSFSNVILSDIEANPIPVDYSDTGTFTITGGYTISGTVTLQGGGTGVTQVLLTLSGDASATTNPDANGNYSFSNLSEGNYTVTPSLNKYRFEPSSRSYNPLNSDQTGQDYTGIYQCDLTVISAHDDPTLSPSDNNGNSHGTGTFVYDWNTQITASVTSPADEANGTRYVCTGWTGTGDVPATGSGTSVTFPITQDSSITWNWGTQYYLDFSADPSEGGSVSPGSGWHDANTDVQIQATPNEGWLFTGWSGDASGTDTTIIVTMDGPKTIIAHFQAENPQLNVEPTSLDFGTTLTQLTFDITNTGTGTLTWDVTPQEPWITVDPASGETTTETDTITVTVDRSGLSPGHYTGTVSVTSNGGEQDVSVSMDVPGNVIVTIEDGYGAPGTSGNIVTVSADNQSENTTSIAGGEFWVTYDSSIGINVPDTGGVETTERSQNHQVSYTVDRSSSTHVVHILLFSLSGDTIAPGTGPILNLFFNVEAEATPGSQSELSFTGVTLTDSDANPIPVEYSDTGTFTTGEKGDINADGDINIQDVIILINFILGIDEPNEYEFWAGDMNDDGELNIQDVILLINKILNS